MNEVLFFDRYSRYKACSDIIKQLDAKGTILEIGSGENCILEEFLPDFKITYLDPILICLAGREKNKIAGNIFMKEFDNLNFDYIVCIDTLDHIEPKNRDLFLDRISKLTKKGVIIASPFADVGEVKKLDDFIKTRNSIAIEQDDYRNLHEHLTKELPQLEKTIKKLTSHGWSVNQIQNGHINWIIAFRRILQDALEFVDLSKELLQINEYIKENLSNYDYREPVYRLILIATREDKKLNLEKRYLSEDEQASFHWDVTKNRIDKLAHKLEKRLEVTDPQKIISYKSEKIKESELDIRELYGNINELKKYQQKLEESIEIYQNYITDIHQSFVFRSVRKFDNTVAKFLPIRPKKYIVSKESINEEERRKTIDLALSEKSNKKDIICFPIINWDYRYQRPQHIMTQFAKNNHRVFYLTTTLTELEKKYNIKLISEKIFQVELSCETFFDLYKDEIKPKIFTELVNAISELKQDVELDAISFVEFPSWFPLVKEIKNKLGFPIIFDCLDDFTGFRNVSKKRNIEEKKLAESSDLIVASALKLVKKFENYENVLYLPNAGEFKHFSHKTSSNLLGQYVRPIIGYFGSIAEWFDLELVKFVAEKRPNWTFIMIGSTYGSNITKLRASPNIHFLGERPYSELPKYLHQFDICIIPFKIESLIESTHPIKIYEYISAGKPVVTTNIPELSEMSKICYITSSKEEFLKKLDLAMSENSEELQKERIEFAIKNTWEQRFTKLAEKIEKITSITNHK